MAGDVEITGASRDDVCSARRRVELIVLASRAKQSVTHFVAIRISSDGIKRSYEKFMVSSSVETISTSMYKSNCKLFSERNY